MNGYGLAKKSGGTTSFSRPLNSAARGGSPEESHLAQTLTQLLPTARLDGSCWRVRVVVLEVITLVRIGCGDVVEDCPKDSDPKASESIITKS